MKRGKIWAAKYATGAGFSLVETVAAMGILALAAIPLLQMTSEATRNTAVLESRLLARTVAENIMARTMAEFQPIDAGVQLGEETQMARRYAWTRLIGPADPSGLQTIEVTVSALDDSQILARLVSIKAAPLLLPEGASNPAEIPDDFLPEDAG